MPRPLPALLILAALLGLLGCASAPRVPAELRLGTYDTTPYANVLAAAVRDGLVDYRAITTTAPGSQGSLGSPGVSENQSHAKEQRRLDAAARYASLDGQLDLYLDAVARFGPESSPQLFPTEDDQLAYYLNAYNAIMLRLWLDHGARDASPTAKVQWLTWFTINQWKVDGRSMSLDYLEQRLIRPTFKEARIHAALVCGAIDCPPLRREPYLGSRLDAQLDSQMRDWLNAPPGHAIDIDEAGTVRLAAILGWYRDDFRPTGGLSAVIETYLDDSDPRKPAVLDALKNNRAKFMGYDWTLNQAP